jgi:hypothetical protein
MGPWGSDLPTRRQPKHRVQQLKSALAAGVRTRDVVDRDSFREQLACLAGKPTARTRFRTTDDIAGRDTSDQSPLRDRTIRHDLTANVDR